MPKPDSSDARYMVAIFVSLKYGIFCPAFLLTASKNVHNFIGWCVIGWEVIKNYRHKFSNLKTRFRALWSE